MELGRQLCVYIVFSLLWICASADPPKGSITVISSVTLPLTYPAYVYQGAHSAGEPASPLYTPTSPPCPSVDIYAVLEGEKTKLHSGGSYHLLIHPSAPTDHICETTRVSNRYGPSKPGSHASKTHFVTGFLSKVSIQ